MPASSSSGPAAPRPRAGPSPGWGWCERPPRAAPAVAPGPAGGQEGRVTIRVPVLPPLKVRRGRAARRGVPLPPAGNVGAPRGIGREPLRRRALRGRRGGPGRWRSPVRAALRDCERESPGPAPVGTAWSCAASRGVPGLTAPKLGCAFLLPRGICLRLYFGCVSVGFCFRLSLFCPPRVAEGWPGCSAPFPRGAPRVGPQGTTRGHGLSPGSSRGCPTSSLPPPAAAAAELLAGSVTQEVKTGEGPSGIGDCWQTWSRQELGALPKLLSSSQAPGEQRREMGAGRVRG